jgi:hypothetical protein
LGKKCAPFVSKYIDKDKVMVKKYVVRLSLEERQQLESLLKKGRVSARHRQHAEILLKADEGEQGPAWKDKAISEAFGLTVQTIERVRKGKKRSGCRKPK